MSIESLYGDLLGRGVDPGAYSTYAGWSDDQIRNAILGSQEYAQRQSSVPSVGMNNLVLMSQPQTPSGNFESTVLPNNINDLYRKYLGRDVDPSGAATYAGWSPDQIANALINSPEYQQRQASSGGAVQPSTATQEPPPDWLNPADYVSSGYAAPYTQQQITGQVDPSWIRQMNGQTYASVKGPGDLSGGEYLVNPNTGKFVLDAKGNPVGVTYPQSNGFSDWVTTPLGGLLMTLGVPLAAAGGVAALEGMGAFGAGAGAAEGAGGLTTADILASTGFTPAAGSGASFTIAPGAYTAALAAGDGAWGLSPELAAELGLAGSASGLTDLSGEAGSAMLEQMGLNTSSGLSKFLGNIGSSLSGLGGSLGTLGLAGTALKALGGGTTPTTTAGAGATPSTYAPRGQVGYDPLLNLLAPKLIARNANSLLG